MGALGYNFMFLLYLTINKPFRTIKGFFLNANMQISFKITKTHFLSPQSHQDCPTTKYDLDKISIEIGESKFEPLEHEKA